MKYKVDTKEKQITIFTHEDFTLGELIEEAKKHYGDDLGKIRVTVYVSDDSIVLREIDPPEDDRMAKLLGVVNR